MVWGFLRSAYLWIQLKTQLMIPVLKGGILTLYPAPRFKGDNFLHSSRREDWVHLLLFYPYTRKVASGGLSLGGGGFLTKWHVLGLVPVPHISWGPKNQRSRPSTLGKYVPSKRLLQRPDFQLSLSIQTLRKSSLSCLLTEVKDYFNALSIILNCFKWESQLR